MRQKDQKMRFTDPELSVIKGLFSDNEDLLYTVRKVMLQFELTPDEQKNVDGMMNETVIALLYKTFLPSIDADAPMFQMTDMLLGLGADIKTLSPEGAWPFIKAKELEMKYLSQQLRVLTGASKIQKISLEKMGDISGTEKDGEKMYVNVVARNYLLSYIDSNCQQLKMLAGLKHETVEQTKIRLQQDSAK